MIETSQVTNDRIWRIIDHKKIKPKSIMQDEIVEYFAKDYIYLGCIKYIHDVSYPNKSR
jgi:hypothetical protein